MQRNLIRPFHRASVTIFSLAIACAVALAGRASYGEEVPSIELCELLGRLGPGDILAATTTGIYVAEAEYQLLYDPRHLLCPLDVAPYTEVTLETSAPDKYLHKLLVEDHRAYVTVRGILWAPPTVKGDDPSIPEKFAPPLRMSSRYGVGMSRTMFIITDVLSSSRVPFGLPSLAEMEEGRPVSAVPMVLTAAVPGYPANALTRNIAGTVVVAVTVEKGKVAETRMVSGDRMLATSVLENIRTWQFKEDVDATFVTTFVFTLELRATGSDKNPRVELHLPLSVKITGPQEAW